MESKTINGLKVLGSDRTAFRIWHDKLVNAFVQHNHGYRAFFEKINQQLDKGEDVKVDSEDQLVTWFGKHIPNAI